MKILYRESTARRCIRCYSLTPRCPHKTSQVFSRWSARADDRDGLLSGIARWIVKTCEVCGVGKIAQRRLGQGAHWGGSYCELT